MPALLTAIAFTVVSCSSDDDTVSTDSGAPGASAPAAGGGGGHITRHRCAGDAGDGSVHSHPAASAATGDPYVIGVSLELTGALSELGEGFLKGAESFVAGTNASGGVAGHPVELVALDHSSKPDQAVANVTRLVSDDGAIGITGFVLSNACNAAERVTNEAQVPLVCSAAEPDMLNPVRPFMFGSKFPVAYQAAAVVDFAETLAPPTARRSPMSAYPPPRAAPMATASSPAPRSRAGTSSPTRRSHQRSPT